jgi:hypothetical protein
MPQRSGLGAFVERRCNTYLATNALRAGVVRTCGVSYSEEHQHDREKEGCQDDEPRIRQTDRKGNHPSVRRVAGRQVVGERLRSRSGTISRALVKLITR